MGKLKQLFCRHKNVGYYQKNSIFHALNGERVYRICEDCGKIIDSEFLDTEEFYRRFKF